MSRGKARLTAAAIVFGGWLLFLMWLALTAGKPIFDSKLPPVLSRPQFLVANLYVVADLQDGTRRPLIKLSLPSAVAMVQPGWPTSIPWLELLQTASPTDQGLPPPVEVAAAVVGKGPFEEIKVQHVLWSRGKADLEGKTLFVQNLRLCDAQNGWEGPGTYVLALTKIPSRTGPLYRVTSIPRSPGYEPQFPNAPIYRLTPEIRKQVEYLIQMYHAN